MKNSKTIETFQLEFLKEKVEEYFKKNPHSSSVVFETKFGFRDFTCKVIKNKEKLQIKEIKLVEAPLGQVQDQEVQAIQSAMTPPQPPPVVAPPPLQPGPPMMPMASSPVPANFMPPMNMAPSIPGQPMQQPMQPQMPLPNAVPPPVQPVPDPAMAAQPPAPAQGPVNWDSIVSSIESAKSADPDGFTQRFGATPQQQLSNPNVPPEVVTNTAPPDERNGQKIQNSSADPTISEASVEYSNLTQEFMKSMNDLDSAKAANLLTFIQQIVPKLKDPMEVKGAMNMLNMLNSYKGTLDSPAVRQAASMMTAGPAAHFGESKKKSKKLIPEDNSLVHSIPFVPGISEEVALVNALKGQTIEDVKVVNDSDAIGVELNLATTDWPAIFEYTKEGKLTFIFKNRRYVLHKKWN